MSFNHLDLFSGIGGFALAAKWAGIKTIGFSEIEQYCCQLLEKRFPGVPNFGDIKESEEWDIEQSVDLITGGFPCQPCSQAGKRGGTSDDRWLWEEMLAVIQRFKPTWVLAENVSGIINMELENVCVALEDSGYEVQPCVIPACAVNAPHRRDRVWIVAHSRCEHGKGQTNEKESSGTLGQENANKSERSIRCDELRVTPDSQSAPAERLSEREKSEESGHIFSNWDEHWYEVATRICRVYNGLSRKLDKSGGRVNRLKGLGNAIVPQIAYVLMRAITKTENGAENEKS